ncbi:MAG TPA: hypothetical protein PK286_03495 [Devosia sp.]|nr:hypothetical protein [Devosia sp.]
MRKLILVGAAAAALSLVTPVFAAEDGAIVGGTAGAWTGGTIGFLLGGPVGAIVGGATGAVVGGGVGDSIDNGYVRGGLPVVSGRISVGDRVAQDVPLHRVTGQPGYGYFRDSGRVYVVDLHTHRVVEIQRG